MIRLRNSVVKDRTSQKNRIKSLLRFHGIEIPEEFIYHCIGNWSKRFLLASPSETIYRIRPKKDWICTSNNLKSKEKVIFIDFWATLCNPCLSAMRESKSVKEEFLDKDVVFVYIADTSSPRKTREQKISEIKGEHCCLSQKDEPKYCHFTSSP